MAGETEGVAPVVHYKFDEPVHLRTRLLVKGILSQNSSKDGTKTTYTVENMTTEKRVADNIFDISGLFRTSAVATFVVEIVSVIVMIGAIAAFYMGKILQFIDPEIQLLLLMVGIATTMLVFLAAFSIFVRFSRRISNRIIGRGIHGVQMDSMRVKIVVYVYALLLLLMGAIGIYVWYLVDKNVLSPWALAENSISLRIFGLALGALFIAILIQIIIAVVGRTASKVIVEVLATDDSEFER